MTSPNTLSGRERAILRAVAAGGAELQLGTSRICSWVVAVAAVSPPLITWSTHV